MAATLRAIANGVALASRDDDTPANVTLGQDPGAGTSERPVWPRAATNSAPGSGDRTALTPTMRARVKSALRHGGRAIYSDCLLARVAEAAASAA